MLRHVWTGNICDADDAACQQLRSNLIKNNISVVAIISDIGKVPIKQLAYTPLSQIKRAFDIVSFFKASHIRFHIGTKPEVDKIAIDKWMQDITTMCIAANVTPLLELTNESGLIQPADIATLMVKHKRWKLLYDPAQLILQQNQDPFARYWTLLKSFVGAIDLHDFKIGHGYKPVGFGDSRAHLTLKDAIGSRFQGWYYLEPTLGRRYGGAVSRSGTFNMAMEALNVLLSTI